MRKIIKTLSRVLTDDSAHAPISTLASVDAASAPASTMEALMNMQTSRRALLTSAGAVSAAASIAPGAVKAQTIQADEAIVAASHRWLELQRQIESLLGREEELNTGPLAQFSEFSTINPIGARDGEWDWLVGSGTSSAKKLREYEDAYIATGRNEVGASLEKLWAEQDELMERLVEGKPSGARARFARLTVMLEHTVDLLSSLDADPLEMRSAEIARDELTEMADAAS